MGRRILKALFLVVLYVFVFLPLPVSASEIGLSQTLNYNQEGQLWTVSFPDGKQVEFLYNEGGALVKSSYDGESIDEVTESNNANQPLKMRLGTFTESDAIPEYSQNYTYDRLGRLQSQSVLNSGGGGLLKTLGLQRTQAAYELSGISYDARGYVRGYVQGGVVPNGQGALNGQVSVNYDPQGQLEHYCVEANCLDYEYDGSGNLLTRTGSDAFGLENISIPAPAPNNRHPEWEYDELGRVLADDTYRYYWGPDNQIALVRDKQTHQVVAHYLYAGDQRVRTTYFDGVQAQVAYNDIANMERRVTEQQGGFVELERNVAVKGTTSAEITYDGEGGLQDWQYVISDRLGSRAVEIGSEGITAFRYSPYGEALGQARVGPFGFAQGEDDSTGNKYLQARYLSTAARFMKPDTMRDFDPYRPSTYNLYQYAYNNPVTYNDPLGISSLSFADLPSPDMTFVIGGSIHLGLGLNISFSFGIGADTQGNLGLVLSAPSPSANRSFSNPYAAVTANVSITNAESLTMLEGTGKSLGLFVAYLYAGGYKYIYHPDNLYSGSEASLGLGAGLPTGGLGVSGGQSYNDTIVYRFNYHEARTDFGKYLGRLTPVMEWMTDLLITDPLPNPHVEIEILTDEDEIKKLIEAPE